MKDCYFREPEENRPRVTPVYRKTDQGLVSSYNQSPAAYYTESGGLYSTVEDYLQFAQMLLNSGELNGKRLLTRKTVELMTSEHVSEEMFGGSSRRKRIWIRAQRQWVRDIEVEVKPPGGSPSSPQTGR